MTEQAKVPAIRFAGFTDPWEQRKLIMVAPLQRGFDLPAEKIIPGVYPVMMSNGIGAYHNEYKVKGPGVVTGRSGTIGNLQYVESAFWPHNTTLWVTKFYGNHPKFIYYLYEKIDLKRYKAGSGVPTLNRNDVHDTMVFFPASRKEQELISAVLTYLDDLITLHQRKYDKLVIFKKSMLEKMFPKDGESVPEIRFAGFTDPWEQRKLGEIVSIGAGAPPSAFSAGNFLYVKVDDLNESSHFQFDSAQRVDANTAVKPIRKGSIIFAKRGAAILGNKVRVLGKTAYIDTNMMALEPRGVDADFLWLFINQTGLYRIADTSTIPQINNKHIEPYPVDIPNMAEQQAIGTFFSRLDDLITLHQRKLELLQDIKKSLLDKMFV